MSPQEAPAPVPFTLPDDNVLVFTPELTTTFPVTSIFFVFVSGVSKLTLPDAVIIPSTQVNSMLAAAVPKILFPAVRCISLPASKFISLSALRF